MGIKAPLTRRTVAHRGARGSLRARWPASAGAYAARASPRRPYPPCSANRLRS